MFTVTGNVGTRTYHSASALNALRVHMRGTTDGAIGYCGNWCAQRVGTDLWFEQIVVRFAQKGDKAIED